MKPHIAQTINDLQETVRKANEMIGFLTDFGHGEANTHIPVTAAWPGRPVAPVLAPARKVTKPSGSKLPVASRYNGGSGKSSPETLRQAAAVAGLPEPFGMSEVAAAAKVDKKRASNFIVQGKLKGWLKGVSFGKVKRTAKYPKDGEGDARPHPGPLPRGEGKRAGGDARPHPSPLPRGEGKEPAAPAAAVPAAKSGERSKLEGQLANALKQRDHARENGREQMEEIFQKDVDRLTGLLEGK